MLPATARANEAFDVTVKALKPDGTINTTYEGSIYFDVSSDDSSDSGATIPADVNPDANSEPYKFKLDAEGVHTFSKAFTFPKAGSYTIFVFEDLDSEDFVEVSAPITITAAE